MKMLYIDDLIYGLTCYLLTHFQLNPYMEFWNEVCYQIWQAGQLFVLFGERGLG